MGERSEYRVCVGGGDNPEPGGGEQKHKQAVRKVVKTYGFWGLVMQ